MTADAEPTMIPMREVRPKPSGMVRSCGRSASLGLRAKRAKSGLYLVSGVDGAYQGAYALTIKVAKLDTADMIPVIRPQAIAEP